MDKTATRKTPRAWGKGQFKWFDFPMLILAGVINATGVILFLYPVQLIDSGISGLSMVLAQNTGLVVSIFLAAINLPLFLLGLHKMGVKFILCSLVAIVSYTLTSFLYEHFNVDEAFHKILSEGGVSDIFICSAFGGLISGIGSGLTIRFGGAIDGIEVLAVMFAKKIGMSVGQFVMAFNVVIYVLGGALSGMWVLSLYSVVSYVVGLKVVDFVVDGFDKGKACFIVTRDAEKVARAISEQMGRGITEIDCRGYYLKEDNKMLYCVVNRFEITQLKNVISVVDPQAFVSINDVSEVTGNRIKFSMPRRRAKAPPQLSAVSVLSPEVAIDGEELSVEEVKSEDCVTSEVLTAETAEWQQAAAVEDQPEAKAKKTKKKKER